MTRQTIAAILLIGLLLPALAAAENPSTKEIVIISGEQGVGIHDCAAVNELFASMLNDSGLPVKATHYVTWPEDWSEVAKADAVIFYGNGGPLHPMNERREALEAMRRQGVGLMCMHQSIGFTEDVLDLAKTWLGGHYEAGWSTNPFWVADASPNREHPIGQGVEPFTLEDEWYFHMRFRAEKEGITSLLTSVPTEAKVTESRRGSEHWNEPSAQAFGTPQVLMWASERLDGGRGVGITGGHFRHNFKNDDYRKLVLNAMVWVAGIEVPENGVYSKTPDYVVLK